MENEESRNTFGKSINLKTALNLKKINIEEFSTLLIEVIHQKKEGEEGTSLNNSNSKNSIKIEGLLPCPVRIPLLDALESFLEDKKEELKNININYELKAASMGLDWLKNSIENEDLESKISDLFISAGFDLFFDKNLIGKFKDKDVFADISDLDRYNKDFQNDYLNLKDPKKHYSMIGVVPAVFLVNTNELKGREIPKTWEDLLKPEFENSISLPVSDFDLFNAILLNIHKKYGEEGVEKLGKNLLQSMHPAQMVKSATQKLNVPAITIMPYFFTKTIKEGGSMQAVWPEDGSIISPLFMLTKKEKRNMLKPIVDLFSSKKVGEILSHKGLFPSTSPEVDNKVDEKNRYMWLGWDYIYNNDIGALIKECEDIFNKGAGL
ncbi:MAG: iron ABC transporter substrate-binding protein [Fusobacteriia bacterium 4572_132]|nr:MAG: iron ABC transporter substrate-binding protein [Fusobacteriia bacterium 4572_132]